MKRLKVEQFGTDHQGIRLGGDKRNPEPTYVGIKFPGGEVTVTRTSDGGYWIHGTAADDGHIDDARFDTRSMHAAESLGILAEPLESYREEQFSDFKEDKYDAAVALADAVLRVFDNPDNYHMAIRIRRSS